MTSGSRDNLPLLTRLVFPSIKDVLFLAFLFVPLMTKQSGVLYDGDTGWHIRNGEHILTTWEFPRADYFSYTRHGAPWFAWEWLADVVMAIIHRVAGLNGVVVWANLLFASTFSLLFYWVLKRGGNLFLCLLFTALAGFASAVHWLARPHLFTMLFVLVWSILLNRIQEEWSAGNSQSKRWWVLPPMILVWANLHGGFVVGLILLLIYSIANFLTSVTNSDLQQSKQAKDSCRHFLKLTGLCLLVTLLNPYGIQLHLHIFDSYLFSQYLVDRITEFASPNFHTMVVRFFELILLSCIVIFSSSFRRLSFVEIGVLVFWTHMALFSVRHVPLFTLLLVPRVVRHGSEYLEGVVGEFHLSSWVRKLVSGFNAYSERLRAFEIQFKGIVYPLAAALILIWVCLNQGNFLGAKVMNAAFDSKQFPVKAAAFIENSNLAGNLFTTDYWGGYMIYRFHPRHKVFFDGRSDMYGKEFLKEYESLTNLEHTWKTVLDKHQVAWILLPVDFGLATALKERPDWQVIYDDQQAIIFRRSEIRPTEASPKS